LEPGAHARYFCINGNSLARGQRVRVSSLTRQLAVGLAHRGRSKERIPMNTITDTGLVKGLLPLKPESVREPACSTCPCFNAGVVGKIVASCRRYPPQFAMTVQPAPPPHIGKMMHVPMVDYLPVNPDMVCWEHPVLQARMVRAVSVAQNRALMAAGATSGVLQGAATNMRNPEVPVHAVGDAEPGDANG
jgi:hypothetical protein